MPTCRRPLWAVAVLTIVSLGSYFALWMAVTWFEIKRELKSADMHPVWHGLALLVPIYGFYRVHAHYQHISALITKSGVKNQRVAVDRTVGGLIVLTAMETLGAVGVLPLLITAPFATFWVTLILVNGQSALNAYWEAGSSETVGSGPHGLEWWVSLGAGGILWTLLILSVRSAA